jgi:hypothetical protein
LGIFDCCLSVEPGVDVELLYNLNDPSGVHISEAGASVISDIILDYVKSPVEGEYTTPNTKKRIRSSTSIPGSTDKQQSKILKPF